MGLRKMYCTLCLFVSFAVFSQNYLSEKSLHESYVSKGKIFFELDSLHTFITIREEKKLGDKLLFYGNVGEYSPSIISITFQNGKVSGEVVIPELDKKWVISANKEGKTLFSEQERHICVQELPEETKQSTTRRRIAGISVPQGVDVTKLESHPSAENVVYIDTDGELVSGTYWNTFYKQGNDMVMTPSELTDEGIYEIWKIVSEDYSAFDINITTRRDLYNAVSFDKRTMLIITKYNGWQGISSTGIARIGSYKNSDDPCFSFSSGFNIQRSVQNLAEVSSHEIGHTFGLTHDGGSTGSYYSGHGDWGPLMGSGYNKEVTQFSKGEYAGANNFQDDLSIITQTNNVPYKTDDHGNSEGNATPLLHQGNTILEKDNNGVIEQSTDADFFSFRTGGGLIDLTFNGASPKPNLNIKATLYDENLNVVIVSEISGQVYAEFNQMLSSGLYYIKVEGVGEGNPLNTGYSDYATLGYFGISGTISDFQTTSDIPQLSFVYPVENQVIEMNPLDFISLEATAFDTDGSLTSVSFIIDGETVVAQKQGANYKANWKPTSFKEYEVEVRATDNDGKIGQKRIKFVVDVSPTDNDVAVKSVLDVNESTCGTMVSPSVLVENKGAVILSSYVLEVYIDGVLNNSILTNTSLNKGEIDTIQLSSIDLVTKGNHALKVLTKQPNNVNDENQTDNEQEIITSAIIGEVHEFVIDTRSMNSSIEWKLQSQGVIIADKTEAEVEEVGNETVYSFCVEEGCYDFEVTDGFIVGGCSAEEWNPAISYPTAGTEVSYKGFKYTNKWYANVGNEPGVNNVWELKGECTKTFDTDKYGLRKQDGTEYFTVLVEDYASPEVSPFCIDNTITEISQEQESVEVFVYPNPVSDKLFVSGVNVAKVQLLNLLGDVVGSYEMDLDNLTIDTSNLPSGSYVMKILYDNKVIVEHLRKI